MKKRQGYGGYDIARLRIRALVAQAKARRIELGWSQHDVANEAGTQQSAISDLEAMLNDEASHSVNMDTFLAYIGPLGLVLRLEER